MRENLKIPAIWERVRIHFPAKTKINTIILKHPFL
jgi:hypothetical protein